MLACGICGSDLHFVRFGPDIVKGSMDSGNGRFAPDLSRDIIMGHEFCVEVVALWAEHDAVRSGLAIV